MSMEKDKQDRFFERFQTSLRDHLLTFNDGVIAIIITIMVLSIPAPRSDGDFWYDAHRILSPLKERRNKSSSQIFSTDTIVYSRDD